ncbi:MAG: hypothetical protein ACRD1T_07740 [Acidimicrobiia bacterium]
MRRSIQALRVGYLAVALACPAAEVAAAEVREFTLDNGLKLIVQEDHRAPVVVSQVWYKVGSSYEHEGITGVSHALIAAHPHPKGPSSAQEGGISARLRRSPLHKSTGMKGSPRIPPLTWPKRRLSVSLNVRAGFMSGSPGGDFRLLPAW